MEDESLCSVGDFPFYYVDSEYNLVNGTLQSDGSCIFPSANCDPHSTTWCCGTNPYVVGASSNIQFICLFLAISPVFYLLWVWKTTHRSAQDEEGTSAEESFIQAHIPKFLRGKAWYNKLFAFLFNMSLVLEAFFGLALGIVYPMSIQENMTVTSRNTKAAIDTAVGPFFAIFVFISDVMIVRLSYALGRGNRKLVNRLLHTGLAGAFVLGTIGGIVMTALGAIPSVLKFFANPFSRTTQELYPGCDFFTSIDTADIVSYWMLKSWTLVGNLVALVMSAFYLSAMELSASAWTSISSKVLASGIWFGFLYTFPNLLTLSGLYEFIICTAPPVLASLYLMSPLGANIRENTGARLSLSDFCRCTKDLLCKTKRNNNEDEDDADAAEKAKNIKATKDAVISGLKLMVTDVIIQATMVATTYTALWRDPAVNYQITAIEAAMTQYGVSYAFVITILVNVGGSLLLSQKMYDLYTKFIIVCIIAAALFLPVIAMSVLPYRREIAFAYGPAACEYARTSECVPYFDNVFGQNGEGGTYSLEYTMVALVLGASSFVMTMVCRSILVTCGDFDYILNVGIASGIIFVPFLLAVLFAPVPFQNQAIGLYVVKFIPDLVMILCFFPRIVHNLYKMKNGIPGNWSVDDSGDPNDETAKNGKSNEAETVEESESVTNRGSSMSHQVPWRFSRASIASFPQSGGYL